MEKEEFHILVPQVYMYTLLLYPLISNFTIDCLWLYIVSVFFGCWAKLEKITQKQDKSTNSNMCKQDSSEPALCTLPLLLCMLPLYHALCCCYCANHSWLPLPVLKNKQVILDSYWSKIFLLWSKSFFFGGRSVFKTSTSPQSL